MSINTMTNAAVARHLDTAPLGMVPRNLDEIARASFTPPTKAAVGADNTTTNAATTIETANNVLFGYIPTEVITLYVATLAAIQQKDNVTPPDMSVFWIFLIVTPVVVWLVYGAKLKAIQKPLPFKPGSWPIWEMSAATAAYSAWAFALPNSPFIKCEWYSGALSGLAVVVASTVLGLLAPFFQHELK